MDWISHKVVFTNLQRIFKKKAFQEEDILNWCQEVEQLFVSDPDAMVQYLRIPLNVNSNRRVILPSNVFKLIDVYEPVDVNQPDETGLHIGFRKMPGGLVINRDIEGNRVMINFWGTPLDDDCMPLIQRAHQPACETYCKIQSFEEDMALGKINQNLYFDWKQRFDGQIQGVKGGVEGWSSEDWAKMTIVMGDMLPRIGYMPLAHLDINNRPTEPTSILL